MASVRHRCQGTNWLGLVVLKVDIFEYLGTSKVRNLGCGIVDCVSFEHLDLPEVLLIQVGQVLTVCLDDSEIPYFLI